MKVTELRVCNCIEDWTDVKNGPIQRQIDLDDFAMMANYERSENHPLPFKPIPLTEEWLLKMGFDEIDIEENKNNVRVFHLNGIYCNTLYGVYYYSHLLKQIKHVHQLQNLYFALTGEELEVKL